jgi:hypothetical protein
VTQWRLEVARAKGGQGPQTWRRLEGVGSDSACLSLTGTLFVWHPVYTCAGSQFLCGSASGRRLVGVATQQGLVAAAVLEVAGAATEGRHAIYMCVKGVAVAVCSAISYPTRT